MTARSSAVMLTCDARIASTISDIRQMVYTAERHAPRSLRLPKQPPPLHPKLRRLPPTHPHQRSCALGMAVRPFSHRERCIGIRRKVRSRKNLAQSRVFPAVALHPPLEMSSRGEHVGLLLVAGAMCQNKVMTEIARIPRPRNEMIDVNLIRERTAAIEARPGLQLMQADHDRRQRRAVR